MKPDTMVLLKPKASWYNFSKIKYVQLKDPKYHYRESYYIVKKDPVHEEDITVLTTYESNKITSTIYKIKRNGDLWEKLTNLPTCLLLEGQTGRKPANGDNQRFEQ